MAEYSRDFASFDGKIWLNAGGEGPLPNVAVKALDETVEWKKKPYLLGNQKFASVPKQLKESIARLINVASDDVILGNSASYGLHLLANGISWKDGDEILLMQNDFPSNILPWLNLQKKKVKVVQIKAKDRILTPDELLANVSKRTRLFCISHVHTFSGRMLEVEKSAEICRENKIISVVNLSHSVGTMPVDVLKLGADAVVCVGYKWLCGPYGTGFCWMKKELRESLDINMNYWITALSAEELKKEDALELKELHDTRKYDVFGTANFFNFVPLKAAIEYFMKIGMRKVYEYNQGLIDHFLSSLDFKNYQLISEREKPRRSNLIVISHKDPSKNESIYRKLLENDIYPTLWKGNIRICPHLYNSRMDIDKLCAILDQS